MEEINLLFLSQKELIDQKSTFDHLYKSEAFLLEKLD